jgi:hypothetical protein
VVDLIKTDKMSTKTAATLMTKQDVAKAASLLTDLVSVDKATAILGSDKMTVETAGTILTELNKTNETAVTGMLTKLDATNKVKADQIRAKINTTTTQTRWTQVGDKDGVLSWSDASRGMPEPGKAYAAVVTPLSAEETTQYFDYLKGLDNTKVADLIKTDKMSTKTAATLMTKQDVAKAASLLTDLVSVEKAAAILASTNMSVDTAAAILTKANAMSSAQKVTDIMAKLDTTNKPRADEIRAKMGTETPTNPTTRIPTAEENDLLWKTFGADVVTIKDTSTATEKSYQYLDKNGVVIGSMKQGTGTDTAQHWFDKNNIEIRGGDVAPTLQNIQVGDYFINALTNQATTYVGKNEAGHMVWQDNTGQYVWDFTPESWKAAYSQILGYYSIATPDFKLNSGVAQKPVTNPYAQGVPRMEISPGSEGGSYYTPTSDVLLALKRDEYNRFIIPTDISPEELAQINIELDKFYYACYGDIRRYFDGTPMYDVNGNKNPEPANTAQYNAIMDQLAIIGNHTIASLLKQKADLCHQALDENAAQDLLGKMSSQWASLPANYAAQVLGRIIPSDPSVLVAGSVELMVTICNSVNRDEIIANMAPDKAALLINRIFTYPQGLVAGSPGIAISILNNMDSQNVADILLQYDKVVRETSNWTSTTTYVPKISDALALSVLSANPDKAASILSLMSSSSDQPAYVYNMNPGLPRQMAKATALWTQLTAVQQAAILASDNMSVETAGKLVTSTEGIGVVQGSLINGNKLIPATVVPSKECLIELDKTNKVKADDIRVTSLDRNSAEYKAIATERITGYYQTYFNTAPDVATLETWMNKAIAGASFEDIKSCIYRTTPEFKNQAAATIETYYNTLLKRPSDAAGKEYYVNKAINGESFDDIMKEIKNSEEYKKLHPGETTDPGGDPIATPPDAIKGTVPAEPCTIYAATDYKFEGGAHILYRSTANPNKFFLDGALLNVTKVDQQSTDLYVHTMYHTFVVSDNKLWGDLGTEGSGLYNFLLDYFKRGKKYQEALNAFAASD